MAGPVRDTSVFSLLLALLLLHLSGRAVLCLGQVTPSAVLQQHRTPSLPRRVSNSYPSHPLSFPSSSSSSNSRSMEEGESPHNMEEGESPHNIEEGEGPHGMEEREGTHNIEEGGGPHNMEEGEGPHSMDHDVRGNNHLILYGVEVPVYKFRGEDAELKCRYDRGTDPLYSVKWYKDDREFYRYLFKMQSPKTTFSTPGVYVDVQRSNERKVLLKKLTFNSTGVYKCEVSADSPHFHTYENQSVMVVVELPERGPTIHGSRTHYRVGDTARLNCTSSRSKPAAQLTWFINGEKVSPPHLVEYYPLVHNDGLESRRLGLSFTVEESHFLKGELVLKCQATVAAVYTVIKEEDATVSHGQPVILEQREHRVLVRSDVTRVVPASTVIVVVTLLMTLVSGVESTSTLKIILAVLLILLKVVPNSTVAPVLAPRVIFEAVT